MTKGEFQKTYNFLCIYYEHKPDPPEARAFFEIVKDFPSYEFGMAANSYMNENIMFPTSYEILDHFPTVKRKAKYKSK